MKYKKGDRVRIVSYRTNEQKINEMFLETFGISYATALAHPDWWQQEYKNIDDKIQKENE